MTHRSPFPRTRRAHARGQDRRDSSLETMRSRTRSNIEQPLSEGHVLGKACACQVSPGRVKKAHDAWAREGMWSSRSYSRDFVQPRIHCSLPPFRQKNAKNAKDLSRNGDRGRNARAAQLTIDVQHELSPSRVPSKGRVLTVSLRTRAGYSWYGRAPFIVKPHTIECLDDPVELLLSLFLVTSTLEVCCVPERELLVIWAQ